MNNQNICFSSNHRPSRKRRDTFGVANNTVSDQVTPNPFSNATSTGAPDDVDPKKFSQKVWFKETFVISGLKHFTAYRIEIHACNHDVSLGCSVAAYVSARTMPEGEPPIQGTVVVCQTLTKSYSLLLHFYMTVYCVCIVFYTARQTKRNRISVELLLSVCIGCVAMV